MHGNQLRSNLTCLNIQIIPQAVCSRYGLAIGAAVTPLVRLLVWICFPVAYPISKVTNLSMCYLHFAILFRFSSQQISIFHYFINPFFGSLHQLLDLLLGKRHKALFRRAELKTLVDLHGNEVGYIFYFFLNEPKPET